jgi:hypothetical protein
MTENAIFICKLDNLKKVTSEYSRLYFGNEFCQQLMPEEKALSEALDLALKRRLDFTFVTPFLTDIGIRKVNPLLNLLSGKLPQAEVVINDWGLLRIIKGTYPKFNLVLGRLLAKQKRGPRILNLIKKVPRPMVEHFRLSSTDTSIFTNFLINQGIKRIELDNLLQGIERNSQIKASLYYPFAYVTTTRYCLSNPNTFNNGFQRAINPCNFECQRYTFKLRHKSMPVDLLLKGNTQFFENKNLPVDLEKINIDRLVYQPQIPL